MNRSNLTIGLYLLLVFAGGVAVGGFGHRLYTVNDVSSASTRKTPEQYRRAYMTEMTERLHLTGEQAAKVEKILDATRDRYREFRERTKPDMDRIQAEQTKGVREVLSDAQMLEYDKMRAEREAKRKQQGYSGGM